MSRSIARNLPVAFSAASAIREEAWPSIDAMKEGLGGDRLVRSGSSTCGPLVAVRNSATVRFLRVLLALLLGVASVAPTLGQTPAQPAPLVPNGEMLLN